MVNGTNTPGDGITGGYTGHNLGIQITIATLAGITWYNAIELIILVFVTFSQYRGLYFWSLFVSASVGLVPYSLGFLLKFFNQNQITWLSVTFITIGWYAMVTGQAFVLYSRLHLVLRNPRVLRRVLAMILLNLLFLHIPTTVLTYGSNMPDRSPSRSQYIAGYNVMEKIQMTGFCIQEFIISALYIWETTKMLRLDPDGGKRKIMYQLVIINSLIILMDLGLLIIEYRNFYIMETMIKGVVYSIKLKLEFAVLGKLVHLVSCHVWNSDSVHHVAGILIPSRPGISPPPHYHPDFPDFVDATRVTSDLTHAPSTARRRSHPWMDSDDVSIAMFEHSSVSRDHETGRSGHSGHSDISYSWSGETQTNNHPFPERELSPLDFTDSLQKQKDHREDI
ncbi:hypothetical protein ASPWEDRAFT_38208 [Aspergillus wentii DTO 134E9]|uniref:DUF7703 domain-containing protein n=1 Tax=Aspergillus wentii DTO 134E9 TaxID=1073089 RepID=A0A1L9RNY0_ASPWE|nr:uncharacterized protein ASPWEDRAFT_38208 [Aspergillus wentii DTO 134E9]KAI9934259.1 hypothetical protein MW887_005333 [Aspergillus wentii]OJJ36602.1 hypothetical protein ASPWEDRAFT_38208 [Aspergillus wentii DTO 134E9]